MQQPVAPRHLPGGLLSMRHLAGARWPIVPTGHQATAWNAQPTASFPTLAGAAATTKATYRFIDLPQQVFDHDVTEAIRAAPGHRDLLQGLARRQWRALAEDGLCPRLGAPGPAL